MLSVHIVTTILLVILASVIINTIIGSVWYLPKVFGNMWMKEIKLDPTTVKKEAMTAAMITSMVCNAIIGLVLWYAQSTLFRSESLQTFLIAVVVTWFAFVVCVRLLHSVFERRSIKYVAIVSAHDLLSLLATGTAVYYI